MEPLSKKHCEKCMKRGVHSKIRTLCNDCRSLLCKDCSDLHLISNVSLNHRLIDLESQKFSTKPGENPDLSLERLTIREDTSLYRAQVAIGPGAGVVGEEHCDVPRIVEQREINAKRSDDVLKVLVTGVVLISGKIVVVDCNNSKLKLFSKYGDFLASIGTKMDTWGITKSSEEHFVTCGYGNKVLKWTIRGETIESLDTFYKVEHFGYGIHYNGLYYCILHRLEKAVTVLDSQGEKVRKIVVKDAFEEKMEKISAFGWDIHSDVETNAIYIPCRSPAGVLCLSIHCETQWFIDLPASPWGISEVYGLLCVVVNGCKNVHVLMLDKEGKKIADLIETKDLKGSPEHINAYQNEIALTFGGHVSHIISLFSVSMK